jgi:hypothetical protein
MDSDVKMETLVPGCTIVQGFPMHRLAIQEALNYSLRASSFAGKASRLDLDVQLHHCDE